MKADKGQFDEVLRRMLKKNPQKTSEIKKKREVRKNTKTDPAYPRPKELSRSRGISSLHFSWCCQVDEPAILYSWCSGRASF